MLGQDVLRVLQGRSDQVVAAGRADLDVVDDVAVDGVVAGVDVVVNCAAWTAVDAAEEHEADAFGPNALGPQRLAHAATRHGARLVHVSTDYVFPGDAATPYAEDAPVAPRSAYGRTKVAGEWAVRSASPDHLVVRTAWLYGAGGACFPRTIARVLRERGGADVVADQVGQPTWSADLADLLVRLVDAEAPGGVYHGTAGGSTSWHGFAQAVAERAGLDPDVVRATTSADFVRPAPRPAYSVLGHDALRRVGVEPVGPWRERWDAAAAEVLAGR